MSIVKRNIGSSGIMVQPIGLGTMPLAIDGRPSQKEAIKVLHAAFDLGMDFVDTADVYCFNEYDIGYCEQLISAALKTWTNKNAIIVATKGGLERPNGNWTVNAHPEHLIKACNASLKALELEAIDIYQLHAPDPSVPFSSSIEALRELKQQGKIRHIGLSNVTVEEIKAAQTITEIVSVQNRCNLFDLRPFYDGVLDYCNQADLAFLPYSPMGGMGGKVRTSNHPILQKMAKKRELDPFQIVLAWLLAKSSKIIPIPGASKIESVRSSAAAMTVFLTPDEIKEIDQTFLMVSNFS